MADKSPKFIDIKTPDKSKPSTTSRPVIVTNRPVLGNDPMVNPDQTGEAKPGVPMARTGKTISPVSEEFAEPEAAKEEPAEAAAPEEDAPKSPEPESTPKVESKPAEAPKPEPKPEEDTDVSDPAPTGRDAAA
jgi:hypothetical protein